ncbi:SulP family inorganic anion transporter [Occultella glacieicola]|uniref:SulP family inorganic anion transporter n=1 Tax=Occultella glacieicola TaxID=2518684 RepID=A0ABY2E5T4_9MICO|nr:SulP family inorganic anion transporter [Occultella glacieicola]TDE95942.1 SulP family inorganic anion transporter [Occultella glacieicola]
MTEEPTRLRRLLRLPRWKDLRTDIVAGLPGAISSVPDGMASGVLAGVNPVHGLYASFAGPLAGGMTASTRLMVITTTSAAALAAGSAIATVPEGQRADAIIWLTLIAGALMVAAGLARLGRYTRFVSHSVMTGFLTGVSVNIIFGQLPDLAGADASGPVALLKAWDLISHPGRIDPTSLVIGLSALVLLVVLAKGRLATVSSLIALVLPTAAVAILGLEVADVSDVGAIPTGLPLPQIPAPGAFSLGLVGGAFAVVAIVLVQGAGVAESAPNPSGRRSNANRDFGAQGWGNVASAAFGGMPVGGSVGQTAINVAAGARTHWAAVFSGVWMLVILVLFAGLVGRVAMPTLAAILIFAAIGSLNPARIRTIWSAGPSSQIALTATFVATLALPVVIAVGIGVALSLLVQLNQEAVDLKVVRLVPDEQGHLVERPAPEALAARDVVVLDIYGSLFYAGARTLQARLPDPAVATGAAVVLRLRGRSTLGVTFFTVVADYARRLEGTGGRLYLSGLSEDLVNYWDTERLSGVGAALEVFPATDVIGESTLHALEAATSRRVRHRPEAEGRDETGDRPEAGGGPESGGA